VIWFSYELSEGCVFVSLLVDEELMWKAFFLIRGDSTDTTPPSLGYIYVAGCIDSLLYLCLCCRRSISAQSRRIEQSAGRGR